MNESAIRTGFQHENRIKDLEQQVQRMEDLLFSMGADFCEYGAHWRLDKDMVRGLGNYLEGCCRDCLSLAYDKVGPELDNLDAFNEAVALQLVRSSALRHQHPGLWKTLEAIPKTPGFARKHHLI